MSRRNDRARYTLPDVINPNGRKCISVYVPDNPYHLAAFRGQLEALARAYSWQNDNNHTALEVAKVWREVVDNTGECSMSFRQDDCYLYWVQGNIETLIYNGQLCINKNIEDGTIIGSNSGHLGNISSSDCQTYVASIKFPANSWVLPNVVNSGDTIQLVNWQGGATDSGQLSVFWTCPSGTAYAFGNCSDVPRATTIYGTDPLQSAPHLAVIAQIGNTYYDVWSSGSGINPGVFVVPAGIVNQSVRLLMNIGQAVSLVASGEMWGQVIICNFASDVTPHDGRTNVSIQPVSVNKWHVQVPYNNTPTGGDVASMSYLYFTKPNSTQAKVKATITNLVGWTNTNANTNNGSLHEGSVSGTIQCPKPLSGGQVWSDWSNSHQNEYWSAFDIRTVGSFSYDIEVTSVMP